MDVAHRPIHALARDLEEVDERRDLEVAVAADLDVAVARAGLERRQPADLEREADGDEQVGAREREREVGPGVDEVRVLRRERERLDRDVIAADLARDAPRSGCRGDDPEIGARGRDRDQGDQNREKESVDTGHVSMLRQNVCAPCAPVTSSSARKPAQMGVSCQVGTSTDP